MSVARRVLALSVVMFTICGSLRADDRSLARLAPADTGLFVEVTRAEDLLVPLTETHVWLTLADLAGQPAKESDAVEWRDRIQRTIHMDPAEAIRRLFARRVAFIGHGPGRAQDAVVMCRPASDVDVGELVSRWTTKAATRSGDIEVHRLPNNVGLAVYDGSLIFGDAGPAARMFAHVLTDISKGRGGRSLAADPLYASLLRRVPANPDGILFARMSDAALPFMPTSAPATSQATALQAFRRAMPELPGPFRGASDFLMALHREKNLLHFTAVGRGETRPGHGSEKLTKLVRSLPQDTLLATGAHVDFAALIAVAQKLPRRNVMRVVLNLLRQNAPANPLQPLLKSLDSATSLAVGVVSPKNRTAGSPPVPAAAVLIATDRPADVSASFEQLVKTAAAVYDLMSLMPDVNTPQLPKIRKQSLAGVDTWLLDLSVLLKDVDPAQLLGELHLCWAVDGDALIVASHVDWLARILKSRHAAAADLSDVFKLAQRPVPARSETLLVVQSGPISDLAGLWLDYLREKMPQVLSEQYWRGRQPGGLVVKLGIDGTRDAQKRRLLITRVNDDGPAAGFLEAGDALVGINGRLFATSQPVREFQVGMRQRPNARWVNLLVDSKADGAVNKTIPLPFVDPMETLRRARAIGKIGQRIIYYDDVPDPAGPRGFLTIELRNGQEPLFAFPQPAAASKAGTP